ncbi:DUF2690 domain-containing protein [Alloactinosynnema sp. L-07]|uniref:DUF2690 domain-containing protein n=1 Tax=Alloactinosynnema sp. L-07 TaxID=1653480 RepID=UPI0015604575|nr:DUF2690 domain-containing protein [Alloactinosynnema sp. L-07]
MDADRVAGGEADTIGKGMGARFLRTVLAALVLAFGFLIPAAGTATAAPACYGQSCYGQDPNAMGCTGIETLDSFEHPSRLVKVELRRSYGCNAAWVRYTNPHGHTGAVYTKSLSTAGMATRKNLAAYPNESGRTAMVSFSETVIGCYAFYIDSVGWNTTCTKSF